MDYAKYKPYPVFRLENRTWPENQITQAPVWCSVDLRDGNQALVNPMTLEQKLDFFKLLVDIGFKEIEIGFPAASDTEFNFARALIERGLIPDDVKIQVLTQAREHIITKTFEALDGVKSAIVHLYNSTSTLQRDVVFGKSRDEIKKIAVDGAVVLNKLAKKYGEDQFRFEYSPESFTGTETDYAAEVCNAVIDVWNPTPERKVIINLPSTVEMTTPNVYADQIEYMSNNLKCRDSIVLSVHTHNDRGTGIASSELALLAGAQRVEGTLFGNGERTGNADIITIAMNLFTQGVDPGLDFSSIDTIRNIYQDYTELPVHPRHPYAGALVFTAFSGSHQDAIKKGMAKMKKRHGSWEVPYLPIDPADLGRDYDQIVRVNSQSGKGGVAFVLEQEYSIQMPREMQKDFGPIVTAYSDYKSRALPPQKIYELFEKTYINIKKPIELVWYDETTNGDFSVTATVKVNGEEREIAGSGNGIVSAFCEALYGVADARFDIMNYNQHSLEHGSKSRAITYLQISDEKGTNYFGAGISSSTTKSSLLAVASAFNRMLVITEDRVALGI